MDIGIVSMRYAKALIEYAKGTGAEDRVYHELRMLERSFRKHPDLRDRKSTRLNSSHPPESRMPSSA